MPPFSHLEWLNGPGAGTTDGGTARRLRQHAGQRQQLWPEINDGSPPAATLSNAAAGSRFRNCAGGERQSGYIDQIVLGARLATTQVPDSFERLTWQAADAVRLKLSDHCPIAVRLRLSRPISSRN